MYCSASQSKRLTQITFALLAFIWLSPAFGQDEIKFAESIKQFDENNDGNLSVEEFRKLIESRRLESRRQMATPAADKPTHDKDQTGGGARAGIAGGGKTKTSERILIPWSASFPQLSIWVMNLPEAAEKQLDLDWLDTFKNRTRAEIDQGYQRLARRLETDYQQFRGSMSWNNTTFVSIQSGPADSDARITSDWMFYPLRTKRRNELWLQLNHGIADQMAGSAANGSKQPKLVKLSAATRAYENVSMTKVVSDNKRRWLISTFIEPQPSSAHSPLQTNDHKKTAELPQINTPLKVESLSPEQLSQLGSARFEIIERPYAAPARISYDKTTQLMVVTGSAKDVAAIQQSIREIRQLAEKSSPTISVIRIQVTTARNLAPILQSSYDENFSKSMGPATIVSTPSDDRSIMVTGSRNAIRTIKEMVKQHESSIR